MKRLIIAGILIWGGLIVATLAVKHPFGSPTTTPSVKPSPSAAAVARVSDSNPAGLQVATGWHIGVFANNITGARDITFSPQGVILVSRPTQGDVVALPDTKADGTADSSVTVIKGLNRPHGLAFYNNQLFIAEENQVVRYNWSAKTLTATRDKILFSLPVLSGSRHNTRSLAITTSGILYVSIGSTCDVCREPDQRFGSVLVSDVNGTSPRLFATGLRNGVFLALRPSTNQLWTGDQGQDNLGPNQPPDEIDLVQAGGNYGWPICYGNRLPYPPMGGTIARCSGTVPPAYALPAHAAVLGLSFIQSRQFPSNQQTGLLVALHGTTQSTTIHGYEVDLLAMQGNAITGSQPFITGFRPNSKVVGRPVDLAFDATGSLYFSDDFAGRIYKVAAAK
jgi:glucose/arabinose dehydrogenase